MRKITIAIPTYNRGKELEKNLSLLSKYIDNDHLQDLVCINVVDNCSCDNTKEIVEKYIIKCDFSISYYTQVRNIGPGMNLVAAVNYSTTEWVMLLGDDDYLEPSYLTDCLKAIDNNPSLGCIIANYKAWDPHSNILGSLREENCSTEYYKAGFNACLMNAWRAHQLSGLTFRRSEAYEEYIDKKLNNLYPQIFFVSYCSLRYDVLHFGHFCLRVSVIPQNKKDWSYGNDALMNDVLENFKYLGVSYKQRAKLESFFNLKQKRYLWLGGDDISKLIDAILCSSNLTQLGKCYIARQVLRDQCYSGKKYRWMMYCIARFILLKKLITGKPISF